MAASETGCQPICMGHISRAERPSPARRFRRFCWMFRRMSRLQEKHDYFFALKVFAELAAPLAATHCALAPTDLLPGKALVGPPPGRACFLRQRLRGRKKRVSAHRRASSPTPRMSVVCWSETHQSHRGGLQKSRGRDRRCDVKHDHGPARASVVLSRY